MKTIKEGANDTTTNVGLLMSTTQQIREVSFRAGVQFAQRWIPVTEELPEIDLFGMSKEVLTKAGDKYSVKCYDYVLGIWSGSPHITVTHWRPIELN